MQYRKNIIAVHIVLASFFFPIALMFLLTGALYTIQIKGNYKEEKRQIQLSQPVEPTLSALVALVEKELGSASKPSGSASIKGAEKNLSLDWGGANREVQLNATNDPLVYDFTVRDTTLHRRMVNLHKAKGSTFSKAVSIAWSVGLFALFASGFAMAWSVSKYRKTTLISTVSGLVTFILYLWIA